MATPVNRLDSLPTAHCRPSLPPIQRPITSPARVPAQLQPPVQLSVTPTFADAVREVRAELADAGISFTDLEPDPAPQDLAPDSTPGVATETAPNAQPAEANSPDSGVADWSEFKKILDRDGN